MDFGAVFTGGHRAADVTALDAGDEDQPMLPPQPRRNLADPLYLSRPVGVLLEQASRAIELDQPDDALPYLRGIVSLAETMIARIQLKLS